MWFVSVKDVILKFYNCSFYDNAPLVRGYLKSTTLSETLEIEYIYKQRKVKIFQKGQNIRENCKNQKTDNLTILRVKDCKKYYSDRK